MNYLIITILTFFFTFSSSIFAANFNYGTEFAAKSELAHLSLINALEKVGGRIYGVGVHGIIIFSDDEGETWTQADSVPTQNTLTDISCSTEQLCWATGHDATILHSNDSGKTWNIQYIDIDLLIWFIDDIGLKFDCWLIGTVKVSFSFSTNIL